jgi:hypothetical protein
VPSPDALLTELGAIANDWRWLAIAWHLLFAGVFLGLLAGWRRPARLLGHVLVAPLLSVSVVAWLSANPFNGTMFAALAALLVWSVVRFGSSMSVTFARSRWVGAGGGLILFGWIYPHFVRTESWLTYLYASPFGVLPCPTLAVVIGMTLIFRHLSATSWQAALMAAGLIYGAIGVFRLGVLLDWGLLLASAMLGAAIVSDLARRDQTRRAARRALSSTRAPLT